jgi:hypothetical protein
MALTQKDTSIIAATVASVLAAMGIGPGAAALTGEVTHGPAAPETPKKRGRPRLSEEEKAKRASERAAAKKTATKATTTAKATASEAKVTYREVLSRFMREGTTRMYLVGMQIIDRGQGPQAEIFHAMTTQVPDKTRGWKPEENIDRYLTVVKLDGGIATLKGLAAAVKAGHDLLAAKSEKLAKFQKCIHKSNTNGLWVAWRSFTDKNGNEQPPRLALLKTVVGDDGKHKSIKRIPLGAEVGQLDTFARETQRVVNSAPQISA